MVANTLVSVVIPCYNYARYLGEAIESALNQTHQPIEVIVVDDGSTDDSRSIAAQYPVELIALANSGVCVAVNTGIRASNSRYVLRLDADDRLAPTYVEETLAILAENPDVHFVYTEVEYFGAATGTYPVEPFNPETLAERNYIHCSALMRRDSFDRVGGYNLNMAGARYEDWDLWLAFAGRGMRGALLPKRLLYYRQHGSGSRVTLNLRSPRGIRREVRFAAQLQDNHPSLFALGSLLKRLAWLGPRLRRGEVSGRFTLLLSALYGVMLVRGIFGRSRDTRNIDLSLSSSSPGPLG